MIGALAVVWHFWISVALVVPAILLVVGIGLLYVVKVEMPRYPRDDQPSSEEEYEALQAHRAALEAGSD